ncbi:MAG: SUMF1/EgtB/PvdO family nonheme iron enzyme, partial [Planctomycetota bacterium]
MASETTRKSCCTPSAERAQEAQQTPLERITSGSTEDMVPLPGGRFLMGTNDGLGFPDDAEGPQRAVDVSPFWIDRSHVTNRQFAAFVKASGYVTEAERFGWSFVFHNQLYGGLRGN